MANEKIKKGGFGPGHGPGPGAPVEKAKDIKGTTKKLVKNYLAKYKISLIIVFIFAVGSTIFSVVGPKILGNATTEIYTGLVSKLSGGEGINFEKIAEILLTLLGLYILSATFSLIQGFTMTSVAQKLTYKLRNDLAIKINKLPMNYFDKKTNGEVLSIITNDIDTLSQNLNQSITQIITAICTLVGILWMMFSISITLTVVSIIILPISVFIVKIIVSKSQKYFKDQQDYLGHVNGQVEEIYGGQTIVKAFNGENKAIEEFKKANNELYKSGWKSQFLSGLMHPLMNFIGNLGYVAIAILGGYLAIKGKITVGNIQSFIQYNKQFTQPITQIAQVSSMLQSMIAASERIFEFLEEKEEVELTTNPKSIEGLKGNIKFDHVKFGYDENKTIIKDFSANVNDGQKIAIVGPTRCW
jgi:ATP-binding cassette subfamily B protein